MMFSKENSKCYSYKTDRDSHSEVRKQIVALPAERNTTWSRVGYTNLFHHWKIKDLNIVLKDQNVLN